MSDEDDDPVVDEVPVYLTHDLCDNLYVFQYPVRPGSHAGVINVVKSRIKPENQEVVLEVGLDTTSVNYDRGHGEQIALSVDRDKTAAQRTYPTKLLDKIRYESQRANIDKNSFAVGTMRGRELILTPINGVLSLLPTLSHVTDTTEKETPVEEEEAKLVRVHPRIESERARKLREASYNHFMEKSGVEPWYNTQYCDVDSSIAKLERTRLTSSCPRGVKPLELTSENYLEALLPREAEAESSLAPSLPDHLTSISSLKQLPIKNQVEQILTQVKTVGAVQLSWLLGVEVSQIVDYLQTCAVLVMGNWVLRSDLQYKGVHNGIPPNVMANARDYILYQFHEGKTVERKNLSSVIGLPQDEIRQMMSQVAVLKRNKLWAFRLNPDPDFIAKYPDVVEQQNLLWEARMRDIKEQLQLMAPPPVSAPKANRRRKDSEPSSSDESSSGRRRRDSGSSSDGAQTTSRRRKNSGSGVPPDPDKIHKPKRRQRKKSSNDPDIPFPQPVKIKVEPTLVKEEPNS